MNERTRGHPTFRVRVEGATQFLDVVDDELWNFMSADERLFASRYVNRGEVLEYLDVALSRIRKRIRKVDDEKKELVMEILEEELG